MINFAGKESDILFATWLLDTLQRFVMRALRAYQQKRTLDKMSNSNYTSVSFARGCALRINKKLEELAPVNWAKAQELILKELNIAVNKELKHSFKINPAVMTGYAAGNSARFDRPVGQGGTLRLK